MPKPTHPPKHSPRPTVPEPPPTVSARWLLSAFAVTLLLAVFCGYSALALLFYQGQWQLLFHPSHGIATPANVNLAYQEIHFDVTPTGQPRLDAWWIPASPNARYAADTVLYLHSADGSLSDTVPALAQLHALGLNVFAIDYQGFGHSAGRHPTERLATDDSTAAWTYLTDERHIPARNLVVYGDGAGAVFAAHLAATFAPAAVILEDPPPPARQTFDSDARARMLPLGLLQKEFLDPSADLAHSHAPLLFLARNGDQSRTHHLFALAPTPKHFDDLRSAPSALVTPAIARFLDPLLPVLP